MIGLNKYLLLNTTVQGRIICTYHSSFFLFIFRLIIRNARFRALVQSQLHNYSSSTSKVEKSKIVRDIIESVRRASPSGGFVKQVNGRWWDVGERARREFSFCCCSNFDIMMMDGWFVVLCCPLYCVASP